MALGGVAKTPFRALWALGHLRRGPSLPVARCVEAMKVTTMENPKTKTYQHRGALRGTPGSACPQPEPNATELPSCAPQTANATELVVGCCGANPIPQPSPLPIAAPIRAFKPGTLFPSKSIFDFRLSCFKGVEARGSASKEYGKFQLLRALCLSLSRYQRNRLLADLGGRTPAAVPAAASCSWSVL